SFFHVKNKFKRKGKNNQHKKRKKSITFLNNFSIGTKYLLAFTISITLFIAATVIVFFQLTDAQKNVDEIIQKNQLTNYVTQLALYVEQLDSIISNYIIVGNERHVEEFEELTTQLNELFERLEPQFEGNDENKFLFA